MKLLSKIVIFLLGFVTLGCIKVDNAYAESEYKDDVCFVSVAFDVSGSMKSTDSHRDMIESLKVISQYCDDNDYICITAYNDTIEYTSECICAGDKNAIADMCAELDGIVYAGDTDNGLGLLTATQKIAESGVNYDRAFVILISDGDTHLLSSRMKRTKDDSDADIEQATKIATESNITINVIEYTQSFTKDAALLSVAANKTSGNVEISSDSRQFVVSMFRLFFNHYYPSDYVKLNFEVVDSDELVLRKNILWDSDKADTGFFLVYSVNSITDFEIVDNNENYEVNKSNRYAYIKSSDCIKRDFDVIFSLSGKEYTVCLWTMIDKKPVEDPIVPTAAPTVTPEPTPIIHAPQGDDYIESIYCSQNRYELAVTDLFSDEDGDIVDYSFVNKSPDVNVTMLGHLLTVDVTKPGTVALEVTAIDSKGLNHSVNVSIEVIPAWKQHYRLVLGITIAFIIAIVVIVCIIIIRCLLFPKKTIKKSIHGRLIAKFIDIKSKNDLDKLEWDLSQYPPEGVSLQDMFVDKGINENLKDLDKVCFYPADSGSGIVLLHNIEGGVFVGDKHIKAKFPEYIKSGDRIYVSVADNASEIELTYYGK